MGVSKTLAYTILLKKYPMTLTLQGSITAAVWTEVTAKVTLSKGLDTTVNIGGHVGMKASAKFDVTRAATKDYNKRYDLAPKKQILKKVVKAGLMS